MLRSNFIFFSRLQMLASRAFQLVPSRNNAKNLPARVSARRKLMVATTSGLANASFGANEKESNNERQISSSNQALDLSLIHI